VRDERPAAAEAIPAKTAQKTKAVIIAAVIAAVVVAVAAVAVYLDQVAPFRRTVLVVDERSISMRYFLKRIRMSGKSPMEALQTLTSEQIIKVVAPEPPYNIQASQEDVERFLKELAGGSLSEADFREWYRQGLDESGLSDSEFRDLTRTNLLTVRLSEYLAQRLPTVAEQVHLYAIPVGQAADAAKVKERLDAGETFETLARELSGGELGWFPREALAPQLALVAFDELRVGETSGPLSARDQMVLIKVAERAPARTIEEQSLTQMKARVLDEWIKNEYQYHKVEFHGFHGGYDSKTDAWVRWQIERTKSLGSGGQR